MSKSSHGQKIDLDRLYHVKIGIGEHIERYDGRFTKAGTPHYSPVMCHRKDHTECGVDNWVKEAYEANSTYKVFKNWSDKDTVNIYTTSYGGSSGIRGIIDSLIGTTAFKFITVDSLAVEKVDNYNSDL